MANQPTLTLEAIRAQRETLRKQMADLDAAERVLLSLRPAPRGHYVLGGLAAASGPEDPSGGLAAAPTPTLFPADTQLEGKKLIKHRILELIAHRESGLTSQMVLDGLRAVIPNYKGHNVSPKLSDYKSQGWLTLDQGVWKITEEGRQEYLKSND